MFSIIKKSEKRKFTQKIVKNIKQNRYITDEAKKQKEIFDKKAEDHIRQTLKPKLDFITSNFAYRLYTKMQKITRRLSNKSRFLISATLTASAMFFVPNLVYKSILFSTIGIPILYFLLKFLLRQKNNFLKREKSSKLQNFSSDKTKISNQKNEILSAENQNIEKIQSSIIEAFNKSDELTFIEYKALAFKLKLIQIMSETARNLLKDKIAERAGEKMEMSPLMKQLAKNYAIMQIKKHLKIEGDLFVTKITNHTSQLLDGKIYAKMNFAIKFGKRKGSVMLSYTPKRLSIDGIEVQSLYIDFGDQTPIKIL